MALHQSKGNTLLKVITGLALLFGLVRWCGLNWPVSHSDGILVPQAPIQVNLADPAPFVYEDFIITPLAEYDITARVLSKRNYSFDASAVISPTDLALGWEHMSDTAILNQLKIRQGGRFYSFRTKNRGDVLPLPANLLLLQSANNHIIPANKAVARALKRVKKGHIVYMQGYLVSVYRSKDGFRWKSSLTRTDSGGGACELIWVTQLSYD